MLDIPKWLNRRAKDQPGQQDLYCEGGFLLLNELPDGFFSFGFTHAVVDVVMLCLDGIFDRDRKPLTRGEDPSGEITPIG